MARTTGGWFQTGRGNERETNALKPGEPPYPKPMLEEVLVMPYETVAEIEDKKAAARLWFIQFCARARFILGRTDLRLAAKTDASCSQSIDKVRRYLTDAEIDAALAGDSSS